MITLPKLYAILDASFFADDSEFFNAADELISGGVTLLQYRNKTGSARQMLDHARQLKRLAGSGAKLIMNDRADLCLAAGFDGVHLGQDDLAPSNARKVVGKSLWIGISTHNAEQVIAGDQSSADYIAIGPVFGTSSKANPDPLVAVEGVQEARRLTSKPLVAIGGVTRNNCHLLTEAGADSIAVISDLSREPRKSVEEFLRILG